MRAQPKLVSVRRFTQHIEGRAGSMQYAGGRGGAHLRDLTNVQTLALTEQGKKIQDAQGGHSLPAVVGVDDMECQVKHHPPDHTEHSAFPLGHTDARVSKDMEVMSYCNSLSNDPPDIASAGETGHMLTYPQ